PDDDVALAEEVRSSGIAVAGSAVAGGRVHRGGQVAGTETAVFLDRHEAVSEIVGERLTLPVMNQGVAVADGGNLHVVQAALNGQLVEQTGAWQPRGMDSGRAGRDALLQEKNRDVPVVRPMDEGIGG